MTLPPDEAMIKVMSYCHRRVGEMSFSELDAAIREPVQDLIRRIALPFGAGSEPEDAGRVCVELIAPAREVEDGRGGHRHGRIVDLHVDAFNRDGNALLEVLDRRHRLVGVLELGEEITEVCVAVVRVADLDGALGDVEERDWLWFGWHGFSG